MATFTVNYNFALPQVGGDKNAWGQFVNNNFTTIDTALKATSVTASAALPRSGGTMTGFVTLNADPTSGLHAVTKQYADAADAALSARVTTAQNTANTAVTNAATAQSTADAKVPTNGDWTKNGALNVTGNLSTSGTLTVSSTAPTIRLNDTDGAGGYVHCNGNVLGFMNNSLIWAMFVDQVGNLNAAGQIYAAGNVIAASDARLKENVETIRDAVSLVGRMRGVFYDRIDTGAHEIGVIAQEMQEVIPQVVHDVDGSLGVSYGNLTAVLIEAVKELSARLEAVESRS